MSVLKNQLIRSLVSGCGVLALAGVGQASELTIPHDFTSGSTAVAAEVNENFTAAETAVNDNLAQIQALQASVTALTTRVESLEAQSPGLVDVTTYYATDLFFIQDDANATMIIPITDGQQTPTVMVATNFEYFPVPGLDDISFTVASDDTVVILQTQGAASMPSAFSSKSRLSVAIEIDDVIPSLGAKQIIDMVSGSTLSGARENWNITYPVVLDAGTYTASVLIKSHSQNQDSLTLDGRSLEGYDGNIHLDVTQLKMPE